MPWAYFERVLKRVFKRVFKRSRLTARYLSLVCRHGQRAVSLALVRLAGRAGIRLTACSLTCADLRGGMAHA